MASHLLIFLAAVVVLLGASLGASYGLIFALNTLLDAGLSYTWHELLAAFGLLALVAAWHHAGSTPLALPR